jgi:3-hydroxyacyl-[acyl-carrier protein] dehydratase/trans-2-decenoyl-[acyl-carrier protein] isomerase
VRYAEYLERTYLTKEEIVALCNGTLLDDPPPELSRPPAPPFLMFDRITEVTRAGNRGRIVGEQDIAFDAWYFQCHFRHDPVQPGALGVDAVWQLIGMFINLNGGQGAGRALGCKEVEFAGQIRPFNKLVRYEVDIRRLVSMKESGATIAIGDAVVTVDGQAIYTIRQARVGCFLGIMYPDYPRRSANSVGGVLDRSGK